MSRILVLGGGGFLGSRIATELSEQGADVRALSRQELDLRRQESAAVLTRMIDQDTTLVVAAAVTPPTGATRDGLTINLRIAQNLAAAISTSPLRHCVYLSSDGVYGRHESAMTEETPVCPSGYYPIAKYATERLLHDAALAARTPCLVLRSVAVFGPGDPHSAYGPNRFVRSIVELGRIELIGEGQDVRDHLFSRDLARVVRVLLKREATGVVNVASGSARTFRSIADDLARISPVKFAIAHGAARTAPQRSYDTLSRSFDITHLRVLLGDFEFTPFLTALNETLVHAITDHAERTRA